MEPLRLLDLTVGLILGGACMALVMLAYAEHAARNAYHRGRNYEKSRQWRLKHEERQ
jgi:hypothetical protein